MADAPPELWPVPRGNYWGYVDRNGEEMIPPELFTGASPFSEGLAAVTLKGKKGYIDATAELVIEPRFDAAGEFSEGLAPVARGRRKEPCFYVDRGGERAFPDWFLQAGPFRSGRAVVALASDPDVMRHSGQALASRALADLYGFTDVDGSLPDGPLEKRPAQHA